MNKKLYILFTIIFAILIVGVGIVLAMESTNYRLDWFTPLSSGGGGSSSSTNYAMNITVGQVGVDSMSSTNFETCLGFWCETMFSRIYLPLILKSNP
jgi:hypothetical protein